MQLISEINSANSKNDSRYSQCSNKGDSVGRTRLDHELLLAKSLPNRSHHKGCVWAHES